MEALNWYKNFQLSDVNPLSWRFKIADPFHRISCGQTGRHFREGMSGKYSCTSPNHLFQYAHDFRYLYPRTALMRSIFPDTANSARLQISPFLINERHFMKIPNPLTHRAIVDLSVRQIPARQPFFRARSICECPHPSSSPLMETPVLGSHINH